jgi:hypothetical protein
MPDTIDISKIETDFGKNDELRDEYLGELLDKAYSGKIMCRMANIKMEAIKPFTEYKPEASDEFRKHFLKKAKTGEYIPMFVYQKSGKFIMSDDYNSYFMYKELEMEIAPCVVIGNIEDMKDVVSVGDPFQLETPAVQVINSKR